MIDWRELGYVPDSDDDEEEQSGGGLGTANHEEPQNQPSLQSQHGYSSEKVNELVNDDSGASTTPEIIVPGGLSDVSTAPNGGHEKVAGEAFEDRETRSFQSVTGISRSDLTPKSEVTVHSTATRLGEELQKGLQTVQDVLSSATVRIEDDTDSPLSSLPSSPPLSPRPDLSSQFRTSLPTNIRPANDVINESLAQHLAAAVVRRSFRPRAPIQLHPYALEDAKYRQSWKERGLQPVHVPIPASKPDEPTKDDSQGADTYQSSQAQNSDDPPRLSSPLPESHDEESQSPIRNRRLLLTAPALSFDDDDLPALSDLLQGRSTRRGVEPTQLSKPTRRPVRLSVRVHDDGYRIYDLPEDEPTSGEGTHRVGAGFIIPPSPPRSRGTISSQDSQFSNTLARPQGNTTPAALPTPMLSSETQRGKRSLAPQSSSGSETDHSNVDVATSSAHEDSEDESQGAQNLRRRIKGVLPASWLKLDIKKQKNTDVQRRHGHSPVKPALERGVAQRRPTTGMSAQSQHEKRMSLDADMLQASSESDSDDLVLTGVNDLNADDRDPWIADVVEDNAIDAMLAPRERKTFTSRRKQQKLKDSFARSKSLTAARVHDSPLRAQRGSGKTVVASSSKNGPRRRKQLKRRHQKQQLTILDAPGFEDKDVPLFLRIAGRRRAGDAERAAQNLSTKYLRLASPQDTSDVNKELERWRDRRGKTFGSVAHGTSRSSSNAQPHAIEDVSDNNTTTTLDRDQRPTQLDALKQSTKATLERIRTSRGTTQSSAVRRDSHQTNYSISLVDHFQHRVTHHNRRPLDQRTRNTEDLRQTESLVTDRIEPLTTLRRVPQPARKRQDTIAPVLQEEPCTAPLIRRRPPKARPQRKQVAKPIQEPANHPVHHSVVEDEGLPNTTPDAPGSYSSYYAGGIACPHFSYPPRAVLFLNDMVSYSPIVGSGSLLSRAMESMADLARRFHGGGASALGTPLSSDEAGPCDYWSGARGIMAQAFKQIASSLGSPGNNHLYPAVDNASRWQKARETVVSLIAYLNRDVYLENNFGLEDFISAALGQINGLLEEFESLHNHTLTAPDVNETLPIFNRLTVFGYQLSRLATVAGKIFETKCLESRQRMATLSFSLAFRREFLTKLNSYIGSLSEDAWAAEEAFTTNSATELETMLLLHKVGLIQVCVSSLSNIIYSQLSVSPGGLDAAEKLACTILILSCVYSIIGKEDVDVYGDENTNSLILTGYSALSNAINAFFNLFLQGQSKSNERLSMLDEFGRRALQWCLWLARTVKRGVADNLLRQIFKHYSTKTVNMLDLFGNTSPKWPNFLHFHLPAEDIVPEPYDTDFQIFLKLVAFTLGQTTVTDVDDPATLRRQGLRKLSLVFSLLPNNGPDVDVEKSIHLADLAAMENRYLLLLTLYHYSPVGYKPDLTYIKNLVEFGKAHYAVCDLVIKCWASIVKSVIPQPMSAVELHQLAVWMQDMIFQICDKLKHAVVDETATADLSTNERNRKNANDLLCRLAGRYAEAIDLCLSEFQARELLTGERLDELLALCNPQPWIEDSTTSCILNVVTSYLRKCEKPSDLALDLRQHLQRVLATQLGRDLTLDEPLLISMVEAWFQIAKTMVLSGNDSWDVYLSKHGTYSFSRIAGNEVGERCHILLLSKVAALDKGYFFAEPYLFLEAWLSSILVSRNDITFEHILTNTLIQTAPHILALGALREKIANGMPNFLFTSEDLNHHRLRIVRHIIRAIQDMQYAADEPLDQGLTKSGAEGLLGVICAAMKRVWQQSPKEERAAWASFMHDVVFEISACTFPNFVIDSWFVDMNETGFEDNIFHLERLFILRRNRAEPFDDEHAVQAFRVACETACAAAEKTKLARHLAAIFAATDFEYVNEDGNYLLDIPSQFFFLKAVFPAYIDGAFDDHGLVGNSATTTLLASPVIATAITVLSSLELRVDLEDQGHMEQFAEVMVIWFVAVGKRLRSTVCDFVNYNALGWQLEMLADLVTLCAKVCSRWAHLHQLFPTSDRISQPQSYVQTYGMYVYEYACSATGLDCSPSDPEFWATYTDTRMRSAKDFGFYLDEPEWKDHDAVARVYEYTVKDLEMSGKHWFRVRETVEGPVWHFNRGGHGDMQNAISPEWISREDGRLQVKCAVEELVAALVLLGVK